MTNLSYKLYKFKHWFRFTLWWWVTVTWNRYINSKAICTECKHTNSFHRWNDGAYCAHENPQIDGAVWFCGCGENAGR